MDRPVLKVLGDQPSARPPVAATLTTALRLSAASVASREGCSGVHLPVLATGRNMRLVRVATTCDTEKRDATDCDRHDG